MQIENISINVESSMGQHPLLPLALWKRHRCFWLLVFSLVGVANLGPPEQVTWPSPVSSWRAPTKAWMEGRDSLGSFAPVTSHGTLMVPPLPLPLSELEFAHLL